MNFKFFLFVILIVGISSSRIKTDDVEATDSIKGVTGTFSGRINATDLQLSDSLKAATGSFTNLTSGYIPYQNSTGTLVNSPIFTNGTNASVGKSSVEAWQAGYRALQIGGNAAIFSSISESGTTDSRLLNNVYFDGAWKPQASGSSQILAYGINGFIFQSDTGLVSDIGYTPTTRFRWTLSGGLNVASKGTFTNIASGDTVSAKKGLFDSLKLGDGSYLKNYVEGSFPCTLKTSDVTVQQTGVIKYTIIGNTVTLTFPFIYGTSNSTTLRLYCGGLTGALDPGSTISSFSTVVDNAVSYSGSVVYTYGLGNYFLFRKYDGSDFTGSGPKGIGNWLYTSRVTIQYTK